MGMPPHVKATMAHRSEWVLRFVRSGDDWRALKGTAVCPLCGRDQGLTGHRSDMPKTSRMTRLEHPRISARSLKSGLGASLWRQVDKKIHDRPHTRSAYEVAMNDRPEVDG